MHYLILSLLFKTVFIINRLSDKKDEDVRRKHIKLLNTFQEVAVLSFSLNHFV